LISDPDFQDEVENRRDAVELADEEMAKKLQEKASMMSEGDAQLILRIHEQEMEEYNRKLLKYCLMELEHC
jgi:ribosome-binding protein aMBF1 (putative translation factor)